MSQSKKILVTGGAGFIGSHLVDALIEKGNQVRVYDNLNPQVHGKQATKPQYLHPEAEFIFGDICDRSNLKKALEGIEVVFHEAAEVGVGQSMYSIDPYVKTNVHGTAVLWDLLVNEKNRVEKVLVASSMSLYGEGRYLCPEHGEISPQPRPESQLASGEWDMKCLQCKNHVTAIPTDEEKESHCHSVYAQTKRDQEVYSLLIGNAYKIPTIACRYFNCYGPRQSLNNPYTGAAAIFSSSIKNDKPPLVYEDGLQIRDLIHIHDLIQAKLILLDHPDAKPGVYNIGTGNRRTILDVAKILIKLYGKEFEPNVIKKYRNGDIRDCFADISKITGLGFISKYSLEKGLQDLFEWGEGKPAISKIDEAHELLLKKGLVV